METIPGIKEGFESEILNEAGLYRVSVMATDIVMQQWMIRRIGEYPNTPMLMLLKKINNSGMLQT
jgi:hypothetical protein